MRQKLAHAAFWVVAVVIIYAAAISYSKRQNDG